MSKNKNRACRIALLLGITLGFIAGVSSSSFADDANAKSAAAESSETNSAPSDEGSSDKKGDDKSQPHELSTAPLDYPIYPEDRPMWVDQPDKIGQDWAELVVQSVPSLSAESSRESLQQQQKIALTAYIDQWIGVPEAGTQLIQQAGQIASGLVDQQRTYDGKLTTSTGEMYQHASVLVLDNDFHTQITEQWKALEVARRLKGLGVLAALGLVGLSGLTMLLKTISPREKQPHNDKPAAVA